MESDEEEERDDEGESEDIVQKELQDEFLMDQEYLGDTDTLLLAEEDVDACDHSIESIGLPQVCVGSDVEKLKKEIREDSSLKTCRNQAETKTRGYYWLDDLLFHREYGADSSMVNRLVLLKSRRSLVLKLAHDHTGHLSTKKVRQIVHPRFTWPEVTRDILRYCRCCKMCQTVNKQGNR